MKQTIEKIIENAWEVFCKYYDRKVPRYSKALDTKKAKNSHWICWNEYDLMFQFGRFFYKELDKINSDIELHIEKNLSKSNFSDYNFADKLPKLKKGLRRYPKVDLIITQEDSIRPFLICGEAKYFHCSVEGINRGQKTAEEVIKKDIETLLKIKELGIAERVIFIIFDDYYCLDKNKSEKCKKIKNLLKKYNKKIKILYHDSRAKLR